MCRGATRLDGARGKKQVWRPMFEPEVFRKQMYCIEESAYDIVVTFWSPAVIRRQAKCAPLPPLVTSLVLPILANLVMEDIENKAMSEFHHPPKVWKRYVDDTFVVIKREYLQQFFNFLNSTEPTVQFTKETESNGVLAFLDVKLTRENTGYLDYTVYRKPTHTDGYLNFRSDHPLQHKKQLLNHCYAEQNV